MLDHGKEIIGKSGRLLAWTVSLGGFLFLIGPILFIIPLSFSSSPSLKYPVEGFTFDWYRTVLQPHPWMSSLKNSLLIAIPVTLISSTLGTAAAYGLHLSKSRSVVLYTGIFLAPLVVPSVIIALALYFLMSKAGLIGTFLGVIIGHVVVCVPFVVLMVSVSIRNLDPVLVRAALNLGASPWNAFRTITLPLISPGLVAGALLAFIHSFDEVILAVFLAGPSQYTLPRQLFSALEYQLDPSVIAVSTLLVLVTGLLFGAVEWLRARQRR
ncbi:MULTISPECIES: ABC transporter permease [Rhizobium/Agrobacterium group]|uniref:ABC transporter permease n=1 Tax=Agrobacterium cucumeris TaxID=2862866 RepID=A0ABY8RVN6_9HYPH|nr:MULTISPECIES: ABC transporter permease [Rhizobium/Agrobacterium group]MCZ7472700.1 ABC transporter permease [Rhizobium rhizogenes]MCZ7484151.1 ABC transporter permease [Rhizobium rhizogenes]WHO11645.1 ABC transporter permease [Agrobacterium cucumeris]